VPDLRTPQMTRLVDDHPLVQAVDAQFAEVAEDERRFFAWSAQQAQAHEAALQAYNEAMDEAIRTDSSPPPAGKPSPPVDEQDRVERMAALRARRDELGRQRMNAVVEAAPQIRQEAQAQACEVVEKVRELVDAVQPLLEVVRDAQAALSDVAAAQNYLNAGDPSRGFTQLEFPPTMTVPDLVAAVAKDADVLRDPTPRRLGMQGGFHVPPVPAWEPPLPPDPHQQRMGTPRRW